MSEQNIPASELVKTFAAGALGMYDVGQESKRGTRRYELRLFASAAVRGNLVYDTTTEGSCSTTYTLLGEAGYVVAVTVTSGEYGWIQTWDTLMYDDTNTFDALVVAGRTAAAGDRLVADSVSPGKVLIVSAAVALTANMVGIATEAVGDTSSGIGCKAKIRS